MSIIVLLFLLSLSSSSSSCVLTALAQANHTVASKGDSTGKTVSMLIVIFIFALCITACCSIYIRCCSYEPQLTIPQTVRVAKRGLDPRVLATCPVVSYSSLKLRHFNLPQNGALQCAVCLAEFADPDVLRLLPKCGHVFHPACIDAWLAAHVTCPVCRGEVSVEIEGGACARYMFDESSVRGGEERVGDGNVVKEKTFRVLLRSHSTGHSLEGFDLKLPEEVMKKIMEDSERGSVMTMKRSASYNVVFRSMEGGESSSSNSNNSKGKSNNFWVLSRTPPFISRSSGIPKFWGVRDEKKWGERTVFHCEV